MGLLRFGAAFDYVNITCKDARPGDVYAKVQADVLYVPTFEEEAWHQVPGMEWGRGRVQESSCHQCPHNPHCIR